MCRWPPPPAARVAGIRTRAKTANGDADHGGADEAARERVGGTGGGGQGAGGAGDRGQDGDAEGGADLVAGHQEPEATPACEAGMPAIEVTETGTKTMPMPRPMATRPGSRSVA